jgi:hypothetical protein
MNLVTKAIKAKDQNLEFDGPILAVGPNGSGKTTLAEALRFLACGHVPALGKRLQDTAALMSDREMSVSLTLPDGRSIRRWIARQDKGFIQGAEASWIKNGKPTEIADEIKRLFGAEDVDAAEALDIRELLNATPNQRAARLEALASAGRKTAAQIAEAVARFTVQRLAEVSDERMPADYMQALALVADRQAAALKANAKMLLAKITDGGLAGALTWANEEKRRAQQEVQGKEKAAKELETRAAEVPEPAAAELQALEERRQELDRKLGAIRQEAKGYEARAARRRAAVDALAAARENRDLWDAYMRDEHAGKCKRLQEAKAELAEHLKAEPKAPAYVDNPAIPALRKEAASLRQQADALKLPEQISVFEEERAVQDLEAELIEAKKSPWSEVLEIAQDLEEMMTTKGMKTASAKPLKQLREIAKANSKDPKEVKHDLDAAKAKLEAAQAKQREALKGVNKVTAERDQLRERARQKDAEALQLEQTLKDGNGALSTAYNAALGPWRAKAQQLRAEIDQLVPETTSATETHARAQDRFLAAEEALAAAGPEEAAPATATQEVEAQLQKVRQDLQRLQSAQALHGEIRRALAAIADAQATFKTFAAIEWAIQRQRDVEISEAGGPLLTVMGEFLQAAGRAEKPYVRAGAGSCSIGWTKPDGSEISVQALSGGEWAVFAAALTTAVLILRNPPLKFLLIEAGEMDDTTLPQLVAGVTAFMDRLTGALVMTPRAPTRKPKGWTVLNYRAEQAVEAA